MTCPKCHATVPDDARECPSCGVLLAKARAVTPPARVEAAHPAKPPKPPGSALRLAFVALGALCLVDAGMMLEGVDGGLQQVAGFVMLLAAVVLFVGAGLVHMLGRAVRALEANGR